MDVSILSICIISYIVFLVTCKLYNADSMANIIRIFLGHVFNESVYSRFQSNYSLCPIDVAHRIIHRPGYIQH